MCLRVSGGTLMGVGGWEWVWTRREWVCTPSFSPTNIHQCAPFSHARGKKETSVGVLELYDSVYRVARTLVTCCCTSCMRLCTLYESVYAVLECVPCSTHSSHLLITSCITVCTLYYSVCAVLECVPCSTHSCHLLYYKAVLECVRCMRVCTL